jgi:hypothetical protein
MKYFFIALFFFLSLHSIGQIDSAFIQKIKTLDTANILRLDTLDAPNDALTQKIRELRKLRSGLTVEGIVQLKMMEEKQKDTSAAKKEFYDKLLKEATQGRTAKLIDNCMINMYRRTFTEQEVDDLVRFYKTSAGQKMDKEFLVLLVESAKGAEQLLKMAAEKLQPPK